MFVARADDSIPDVQLGEVTVKAERGWVEKDKIVYIPTSSEKKLSNSAETLIESMHIPMVIVRDGAVLDRNGNQIPFFINGEPATQTDLATFWPKEALRVEYLENPSDPKYQGVPVAINFMMRDYSFGGVTKTNINQQIPLSGRYSVASKLVYKKMTFGSLLEGNYGHNKDGERNGTTIYRDIFFNGVHYDDITREEHETEDERGGGLGYTFNAKYTAKNVIINHSISFGWNRNPGTSGISTNKWTPDLFESEYGAGHNSSYSLSPRVKGNYYVNPWKAWHFTLGWSYAYDRNDLNSWSQLGEDEKVINSTKEDVNTLRIAFITTLLPSGPVSAQLNVSGDLAWYKTHYRGSANEESGQNRQTLTPSIGLWWKCNDNFTLVLKPGLRASMWQVGDIHRHTLDITMAFNAYYTVNRKLSLSGSVDYYAFSPSASNTNPVLVKTSDLMWTIGNPDLKSYDNWLFRISSTYIPCSLLSLSGSVNYTIDRNYVIPIYEAADADMGGVVARSINGVTGRDLCAFLQANFSLLENRLSIGLSSQYFYKDYSGIYGRSISCFQPVMTFSYTLQNCRFSGFYQGSRKYISDGGLRRGGQNQQYGMSFTYGTGNWYLNISASNFFNKKIKFWEDYNSAFYSTHYDSFITGRSVGVSVTYTFGYGKKVDSSIDISGPDATESSVR